MRHLSERPTALPKQSNLHWQTIQSICQLRPTADVCACNATCVPVKDRHRWCEGLASETIARYRPPIDPIDIHGRKRKGILSILGILKNIKEKVVGNLHLSTYVLIWNLNGNLSPDLKCKFFFFFLFWFEIWINFEPYFENFPYTY